VENPDTKQRMRLIAGELRRRDVKVGNHVAISPGAVWSVARGLARNVRQYKSLLSNCDQPRRNDLDGRGMLSEEALAAFTIFFLTVCIDQVNFMESLVQPDRLRARILPWAEDNPRAPLRLAFPPYAGLAMDARPFSG
jgi:hypothetical protein